MNTVNSVNPQTEFKINQKDPRSCQQFLQFSHDMYQWQQYIHDDDWWQQRESACLALFESYGYDLLIGGWYCLIRLKRAGWQGISDASLLFANAFLRPHPACWPPLSAKLLRREMLDSYSQKLLPLIQQLPLTSLSAATSKQLLSALFSLEKQALKLQSQQIYSIRLLIALIKSHAEGNTQPLSQTDESNLQPNLRIPSIVNPGSVVQCGPRKIYPVWRAYLTCALIGSVLTLSTGLLFSFVKAPAFLAFSHKIWPNNPWYNARFAEYKKLSESLPINNSHHQIGEQFDQVEQRLIASEKKTKPYMTVSELKTQIYELRKLLLQQPLMIENQLNELEIKKRKNIPIAKGQINELQHRIEALNARLLLLEYQ